eukprot:TRINITY_DN33798_c0_g1_i1.p1 TRINITY_DN33798_c0_g1~~TRINITY_DN33798_c0_g1_i1.p1  ORF type:complete len:250 (+),score=112.78 TRINITY_DN33798_c0_g1_i1:25-774(+)
MSVKLTLHVKGPLATEDVAVEVTGAARVEELRDAVAAALGVDAEDIELVHHGEDLGETVEAARLCEGDEVEAKPSKRFEAKRKLSEMGVEQVDVDFMNYGIIEDHQIADNDDDEKAEVVQLMIDADPSIATAEDELSLTPMILASEHGYYKVVETLLKNGADPDKSESEAGTFPLITAIRQNHYDVAQLLTSYGADPLAQDFSDASPISVAKEALKKMDDGDSKTKLQEVLRAMEAASATHKDKIRKVE